MSNPNSKRREHLKVLGINNIAASKEDIEKAFRKKSLQKHPDKEGGSTEAQQELGHSKDFLMDPQNAYVPEMTPQEKEALRRAEIDRLK
eukprot:gene33-165_t